MELDVLGAVNAAFFSKTYAIKFFASLISRGLQQIITSSFHVSEPGNEDMNLSLSSISIGQSFTRFLLSRDHVIRLSPDIIPNDLSFSVYLVLIIFDNCFHDVRQDLQMFRELGCDTIINKLN